jgi:ribosomal protein S18 acetylase RimI-like enzyme
VSKSGPAIRVRRARRDDWPAARELLREIDDLHAQIAPEYFRSAPRSEDEWLRLLEEDNGAVFVAEPLQADGAVAVLVARLYDTPDNPAMVQRRRLHIETLVVCCKHRRQGIGRRLMGDGVAWGRGLGAVEVVLTTWVGNEDAEAFYERLGYRVLSRVLSAPLGAARD